MTAKAYGNAKALGALPQHHIFLPVPISGVHTGTLPLTYPKLDDAGFTREVPCMR